MDATLAEQGPHRRIGELPAADGLVESPPAAADRRPRAVRPPLPFVGRAFPELSLPHDGLAAVRARAVRLHGPFRDGRSVLPDVLPWIGNGVLDNSLENESLLCEFVGAPVSEGGVESLVVGPPHIVVGVGA